MININEVQAQLEAFKKCLYATKDYQDAIDKDMTAKINALESRLKDFEGQLQDVEPVTLLEGHRYVLMNGMGERHIYRTIADEKDKIIFLYEDADSTIYVYASRTATPEGWLQYFKNNNITCRAFT